MIRISLLSGRIAEAMNMQMEAFDQARKSAATEAESVRYANEKMFDRAREEARNQAFQNRRCAEILAKYGKYHYLSGYP